MLNFLTAHFLVGYGLAGLILGFRNKGNLLWSSIRYDPWLKKYGRKYINISNIIWGLISIASGILILVDR